VVLEKLILSVRVGTEDDRAHESAQLGDEHEAGGEEESARLG